MTSNRSLEGRQACEILGDGEVAAILAAEFARDYRLANRSRIDAARADIADYLLRNCPTCLTVEQVQHDGVKYLLFQAVAAGTGWELDKDD